MKRVRKSLMAIVLAGVVCLALFLGLLLIGTSSDDQAAPQPRVKSNGPKAMDPGKYLAGQVLTEIHPYTLDERNRLLAKADAEIREGMAELAKRYAQLKKGEYWQDVYQRSETGRISIWLRHTHLGKGRTTQKYVPENDRYSVLVIIRPPPAVTSAMAMFALYPNLGLVGQVQAGAENADLDAALKKLVSDSLKPLKELDAKSTAYQPATQPGELGQRQVFPESTFVRAFERGNSLVIVRVHSVHSSKETRPGKFYFYNTTVIEPIIIGDLRESDIGEAVELFAGSSFGDALTPGSTYALFISKGAPYHLSWSFRNNVVKLDGFSDENLQALVEATTAVYKKTSIREFRESKFREASSLPILPEEILAICERFKANPQSRAGFAKKIYESDMGSRLDISEPSSSIMKYLPPKIILSRKEIASLLGEPTLKCGRSYKWFCGPDKDNPEHVGILLIAFDKYEKATRVLYNPHDKIYWVKADVDVDGETEKEKPQPATQPG